jgi:hypothetical protein
MVTTTRSNRSGPVRAVGHLVLASLACLLMAGLLGTAEAYSEYLGTNREVCGSDEDGVDILSITVPLQPEQGNTLYVFAKTTTKRSAAGPWPIPLEAILASMTVLCPESTVGTSRNHRGMSSPDQTSPGMLMYASQLYHPVPGETEVTCTLRVRAGGRGCLVFQAGASNTWLHASVRTGGWVWGTNLDAHNAVDDDGHNVTIIGPGLAPITDSYPTGETMDLGTSEYVLKGRRFSADPSARSLDVYNDIQLTCQSDEDKCNVTATLLVQRMKSPTSSIVCHTTTVSQTKTMDTYTHHQKLYVNAYGVGFNGKCADGSTPTGRSFIVKSLVKLNSGNNNKDYVIVEFGTHNDPALVYFRGASITNVLQNF